MRKTLRRHRLPIAVSAIFTGLTLNVWIQDGTWPFLVVLAAVLAGAAVLGSVGWFATSQVVRHARREAAAISAGNHPMKEVTK